MFTSTAGFISGEEFSNIGEGDEFMWHQFQNKDWGVQDFEGHGKVDLHNSTGQATTLIWLFLDSQLTVDLKANNNMLVNIWTVQDEDAIFVHCNSGVKCFNQISDLTRYGTVW